MRVIIDTDKKQIQIKGSFYYWDFKNFWDELPEDWKKFEYVHEDTVVSYPIYPVYPVTTPGIPSFPSYPAITCEAGCGCK